MQRGYEHLKELTPDIYELEMEKSTVYHYLPTTFGELQCTARQDSVLYNT